MRSLSQAITLYGLIALVVLSPVLMMAKCSGWIE